MARHAYTHTNTRKQHVSADTLPDLAFVSNVTAVSWQNTQEDLRSDHSLIEVTVDTGPSARGTYSEGIGRRLKLVQWDAFRKKRAEGGRGDEPITDIDEWTATLNRDVDAVTCHIPPEAKLEVIDSRLLHMAQWEDLSNGLERQMHGASAWRLFRHLLDPEDTRAAQSHKTRRLVTDHKGDDLLGAIRDRYFNASQSSSLRAFLTRNQRGYAYPMRLQRRCSGLSSGAPARGTMDSAANGSPIFMNISNIYKTGTSPRGALWARWLRQGTVFTPAPVCHADDEILTDLQYFGVFRNDRKGARGGGVLIATSKLLPVLSRRRYDCLGNPMASHSFYATNFAAWSVLSAPAKHPRLSTEI
ncbi:hypothetical protein HPB52_021453 [Rhipicephalus sanguineus]|uniref:Tick transposon n=1 Tax=Rhipicephalus sanguineus TaxID=34632 RepID=A0A9D4SVG2_RHISA|nr:hypothetical protein HPB52_021453 [Rhipicephalus sanguineus]